MGWLGSWARRTKFTVDYDKIDSDLSAFPYPIHIGNDAGIADMDLRLIFDELSDQPTDGQGTDDNFNISDGNPNFDRWMSTQTVNAQISGNKLKIHNTGSDGRIRTNFGVDGDFDIQVDHDVITYPASETWTAELRVRSYKTGNYATVLRTYKVAGGHRVEAQDFDGTTVSLIGALGTGTTISKFNILRSGSTTTLRWWSGSSWYTLGTSSVLGTDAVQIELRVGRGGSNPYAECDFDNFIVNSADWVIWHNSDYQKRIAVTLGDGETQCETEIEVWWEFAAKAQLHVLIPTLHAAGTDELYLYWDKNQSDNPYVGIANDAICEDVWDSDFVLVQHQSTVYDSTANSNDITAESNASSQISLCGREKEFNGSSNYRMIGDAASLRGMAALTIELLLRVDTAGANERILDYCSNGGANTNRKYRVNFDTASPPGLAFNGFDASNNVIGTCRRLTFPTGADYKYMAYTYDGTNGATACKLFEDGTLYEEVAGTGNDIANSADGDLSLGRQIYTSTNFFDGALDEVRISKIDRSAAYIKATYNGLFDNLHIWSGIFENYGPSTYLVTVIDGVGLADNFLSGFFELSLSDSLGLQDAFLADYDAIVDQLGLQELIDSINLGGPLDDSLGLSDEVIARTDYQIALTDQTGLADFIAAGQEEEVIFSDGAGLSDIFDAFNWTQWLALNLERSIQHFKCVLTGEQDGLEDLEVPISAFQARKRSGEQTYLSVTVKEDFDTPNLINSISARANGQIVVYSNYSLAGESSIYEETVRANLDNIRTDDGPRKKSITLSGYRTKTYSPKNVVLSNSAYRYVSEGRIGHRFPFIDPFLNPGDTLNIGTDQFRIDYVAYSVSETMANMEVREI